MEIFNVGILEIVLILVIAVIVLGPDGMVKSAHSMGVWLRKIIKSPIWAQLMDTQRELRDMPTRFVREAGLEEDIKELKKTQQDLRRTSLELRNIDITGGVGLNPTVPPVQPAGVQTTEVSSAAPESPEGETNTIAPPQTQPQPLEAEIKPDSEN